MLFFFDIHDRAVIEQNCDMLVKKMDVAKNFGGQTSWVQAAFARIYGGQQK
jgi:hypothetical protein